MDYFLERIQEDPMYALFLPLTIETHRIMQEHQDYGKPRIIRRHLTVDGLTRKFTIGRMYKPTLNDEIEQRVDRIIAADDYLRQVPHWLKNKRTRRKIRVMAAADCAENMVYAALKEANPDKKRLIDNLPPLLERRYGRYSIPNGYRFNPHYVRLFGIGEDIITFLNAAPIDDFDTTTIDMNTLMDRLCNSA